MSELKRPGSGGKSAKKKPVKGRKEESVVEDRKEKQAKPPIELNLDADRDERDEDLDREHDDDDRHHDDDDRDYDRRDDDRDYDDEKPQNRPEQNAPVKKEPPVRLRPADEYLVQTYFDKQSQKFVSEVLEIPELKSTARSREMAEEDLLLKIDDYLEEVRRRNATAPEAIQARSYPDHLDVPVSQSLFRKLDVVSRKEKVSLDQLVVELLTTALERKPEARGGHQQQDRRPGNQPHQHHGGHDRHNRDRENRGNRQHNNRGGQGQNRGGGRNYHDTMGNRDNFMEYVRNLEKNGGTNNRWKK